VTQSVRRVGIVATSAIRASRDLASLRKSDVLPLLGVITQSAVVGYVSKHVSFLGPLARMTAVDVNYHAAVCGCSSSPPLTVSHTATARAALESMVDNRLSGMPVVDDAGVMVANIALADVRGLVAVPPTDLDRVLALPVVEYLREVAAKRVTSGDVPLRSPSLYPVVVRCVPSLRVCCGGHARAAPSIHCELSSVALRTGRRQKDTFATVLELLVEAAVHRVTVVDADHKPVGVITLTDVLREVLSSTAPPPTPTVVAAAPTAAVPAAAGAGHRDAESKE
jgi:CBS domain-containing protein